MDFIVISWGLFVAFVSMGIVLIRLKNKHLQEIHNNIKETYPFAYNNYLRKYNIVKSNIRHSDLKKIASRQKKEWEEEDFKLQQKIKREKEIENQCKRIQKNYSKGFKRWKLYNRNPSCDQIVLNEWKIKDYERLIRLSDKFVKWEEEQRRYTDECYQVSKSALNAFGHYLYDVPFLKVDEDGNEVSGEYKVLQFFVGSYCLECDLDYTGFESIRERANLIEQFKNCERYYVSSVSFKIREFLIQLSETHKLSIYLCSNNTGWSVENLKFHYNKLIDSQIVDEISNGLSKKTFKYDYYPRLKNRHIVIIDIQTNNNQLKTICENIIKTNQKKQPLITYISLLKEFDRNEMKSLIYRRRKQEEEVQKEKESEEKGKIEFSKFKIEKSKILELLQNNGIKCFYHFTAIENLDSIRKLGGLYSWWYLKQNAISVPCLGGSELGQRLDVKFGLHDYVRLSFCNDHPMIYRLQQTGKQLVLLKIMIEVATLEDTLFSNVNATDSNHSHGGSLSDLQKVNFNAVKRNYVRRDDEDFKLHQAEIMVKTFVPIKYIINIDSPLYI